MSLSREVVVKISGKVEASLTQAQAQTNASFQALTAQVVSFQQAMVTAGATSVATLNGITSAINSMSTAMNAGMGGITTQLNTMNATLQQTLQATNNLAGGGGAGGGGGGFGGMVAGGTAAGIVIARLAQELAKLAIDVPKIGAGFENFEIRLQALSKSSAVGTAQMQQAVKLALSTPFDVREMVSATVNLEKFGASAKNLLPIVSDMAALMGKDLPDAANAVGKAWEGSVYGVRILRNEYGITNSELVKHGAILDRQGRLYIQSEEALNHFRAAFLEVMNERFLGGSARMIDTLGGRINQMGDAWIGLAKTLSTLTNPALKEMVSWLTEILNKLNQLTQGKTGFLEALYKIVSEPQGRPEAPHFLSGLGTESTSPVGKPILPNRATKQAGDPAVSALKEYQEATSLADAARKGGDTQAAALRAVVDHFGDVTDLKDHIRKLQERMEASTNTVEKTRLENSIQMYKGIYDQVKGISSEFETLGKKMKDIGSEDAFIKKTRDVREMAVALKETNDAIEKAKALLKAKGFDTSDKGLGELRNEFQGKGPGAVVEEIEKLMSRRNQFESAIEAAAKKADPSKPAHKFFLELQRDENDFLEGSKARNKNNYDEQIRDVDRVIEEVKAKLAQRKILEEDASDFIAQLETRKIQIRNRANEEAEKTETKRITFIEKMANEQEKIDKRATESELKLNRLREKGLNDTINALKTRLLAGENVEAQLVRAVESRIALEEKAIEDRASKELQRGVSLQTVQRQVAEERIALMRQEIAEIDGLIQKQKDEAQSINQQFNANRIGGAASPLKTAEEEAQIGALGKQAGGISPFSIPLFNLAIGPQAAPSSPLQAMADSMKTTVNNFDAGVIDLKTASKTFETAVGRFATTIDGFNAQQGLTKIGQGFGSPVSAGLGLPVGASPGAGGNSSETVINIDGSALKADPTMAQIGRDMTRQAQINRLGGSTEDMATFNAITGGR